ncbi:MAG: hypothetical protein JST00_14655 [Deltaproteobacteria bacterium]|nr:hypothetical protein [Deltaproteobacteria bacterium]
MPRSPIVSGAAILAAGIAAACSASGETSGTDESFQTELELATRALQILGAQKVDGAQQQCNQCHDINRKSLRAWGEQYAAAKALLDDPSKTAKQKVDDLRIEQGNPRTPYSPKRLGFLAAGIHIPELAESKKLAAIFDEAFGPTEGKSEYRKLRDAARMPIDPEHERLGRGEFRTVQQWVDRSMPKLDELLFEPPRPTECVPLRTDELTSHLQRMKTQGWAARNREQSVPMFACPTANEPQRCFTQKVGEGDAAKDLFPLASSTDYAKTWAAEDTVVRVVHEMPHATSFWSRNSADGRFISSGGSSAGAFVVDLAKQLATNGAERREIGVSASYDPSFMPDNSGLLIQGNGTHFCTQDLFASPATTNVSFQETQCSKLDNVALYQSVGRRLADNQMSDYFIVNNSFESDDGYGQDPTPTFGEDQRIAIKVMISTGTESGYAIGQIKDLHAPWEGDTMMSPTTQLLASRISGENGQAGYSIRKLSSKIVAGGYEMKAEQVGRVCIPGGKANFSFDERFLVTHHYLTRSDFPPGAPGDEAFAPYQGKSTADIYVVDLLTGETLRATHMAPGQLALYPHYRSDGWLYFLVRDKNTDKEYYAVSDVTLRR